MEKTLTCESFVIEDLLKSREEIENLKKENDELKSKIVKLTNQDEQKLFNNSGIYFEISETTYSSSFEELSKKVDIERIKEAINLANGGDYELLDKIRTIELRYSDYIGKVKPHNYTHLIIHGGYKFIVDINANNNSFNIYSRFINNENVFLDKGLAEKKVRRIAIENLNEYIEWYGKKQENN